MGKQREKTTYEKAGVSIPLQEQALQLITPHCLSTHDAYVLGGIGPFASAVDLTAIMKHHHIKEPIMLQSTDGPGTIPLIAQMARDVMEESYLPLGYNVAAHCFADAACAGGIPITFLDNISSLDLDIQIYREIVAGMAEACREIGCRLTGGEMAQLPGMLPTGVTDFAGFVTALVDRKNWINPRERIRPWNVVVGLPATFPHLNGISLVRKILFDQLGMTISDTLPPTGESIAKTLLQKQPNYGRYVLRLIERRFMISGASHITGGGLYDNIIRNLPDGCRVILKKKSWKVPKLYRWLIKKGNVPIEDAYHTWNMGIGFVLIFPFRAQARAAVSYLKREFGVNALTIGKVVEGERGVEII